MTNATREKLTPAEKQIREAALGYPSATEDFPWGHRAFKVNKKIFATLVSEEHVTTVSVKLPRSNKAALKRPYAAPTHYGMGKYGWVTFTFDSGDDLPVKDLLEWLEESYRAIAPKRLVQELDSPRPKAKKLDKKSARKPRSISYAALTRR
jgi:predicted DNA-binding protein (MmcQ/YjbR family)